MASKEYESAWSKYNDALSRSNGGGPDAKAARGDKAKIMDDIRGMEREAAREGIVLNPIAKGGKITVKETKVDTKKSLQEAYIRGFDEKAVVELGGKRTTLREYHRERLLTR